MDRATLTEQYLARITESGAKSPELIGRLPESDILAAFYRGTYLARPVFLGRAEQVQAHGDLENLRTALSRLPEKLFGGDFAAFARAVGLSEVQVSAVMRGRGTVLTRQTRADMYIDGTGFKLLELNIGSAIGGMDNAYLCRGLLEHPLLADFARTRRLGYVDTLREQVNNVLLESGFEPGDRPVVALTDWPSNFENEVAYMRLLCDRWGELGLEAYPCHVGQLEARDGRVWLGEKPVDIVFRTFVIAQLLESAEAAALLDPILDAAERGEVKFFTPLDYAAYASKGALAMLSDEGNRGLFEPEVLASLDRILPWTRLARSGPVTLETGERVDLLEYAVEQQDDLVLKPTSMYGNRGVVLGWAPELTAQEWREKIDAALEGPYILQRRVRPVPELFPDENGELQPWNVLWGMFTVANGYGGANARATPSARGTVLVNRANGIHSGPALTELPGHAVGAPPRFRSVIDRIVSYRPSAPVRSPLGHSYQLSANESPYPPLPSVLEAINRAALEANRYPDNACAELIAEISARFAVPEDAVAVGCGSVGVTQMLLEAVAEPGAQVLYAWRSFEAYPILTRLAGAESVEVPLRDGVHDLARMADAVTERTRLIFVCNPNNPTGTAVPGAELAAFLDRVPADCLVVLDEAYREYVRDQDVVDGLTLRQGRPNVVVLRTFSKAYGLAGLRTGFVVGDPAVIEAIRKAYLPFSVNSVAQAAAIASLRAYDELMARVRTTVGERERVRDALVALDWQVPPSEANFLWVGLGEQTAAFGEHCARAGVIVRSFAGEGARVSIGSAEENSAFLAAAAAFAAEGARR
jgi:histidinol-phosphate aminotransferase